MIALNIFDIMALKTLGHTHWLIALMIVGIAALPAVDAFVSNTTPKQVWLNRLLTVGLLVLLVGTIGVFLNQSVEHFYRVEAVPITRIGSVAKNADGDQYRVVEYRLKGQTKRVRVPLKQITVTDGRDPKDSLDDIKRGTIKAKLTLKPRYQADAKTINRAFAKHLLLKTAQDGYLTVELVAPAHYHRLSGKD